MPIPFIWLSLGWTLGILAGMAGFISFRAGGIAFLISIPLLTALRGQKAFLPVFILSTALLGILSWDLDHRRPFHAVEYHSGFKGKVQGIVKTRPYIKTRGKKVMTSFVLSTRWIQKGREDFYKAYEVAGDVQVFLFQNETAPQFGDRVEIFGALERPEPAMNPGEFDYQKHLARQDIYAVLKGFGRKSVLILNPREVSWVKREIARLQDGIEGKINRLFAADVKELTKALITGKRKDIAPEVRDEFMRTGTSHLLAISGLNIVLVAGTFYLGMIAAGMNPSVASLVGLVIALLYVFVSGAGLPVQRAGWMAGAVFLALILNRERHSVNLFFMAYFAMLVADTKNLINVSFQLSFLSVFSLMICSKVKSYDPSGILFRAKLQGLEESLAAFLGTLPVVLHYFNVLSLTNVFANLLAVPFFHLALLGSFVSLALGDFPIIGSAAVACSEFFTRSGVLWIRFWADFDWGYIFLRRPAYGQMILYYLFLAACLGIVIFRPAWKENKKMRGLVYASVFLWITVFASFFIPAPRQPFSITLFAAGKNEMIHLDLGRGGGQWLINTGRSFPSNQAEWILTPYLRSKGIKNIKGIFLTDFLKKHAGGLTALARNFNWEFLITPHSASAEIYPQAHRLGKGDCVRYLETSVCVKGVIRGQMITEMKYQNNRILYLPDLNESVLQWLEREPLAERASYDFLILPAVRSPELLAALMNKTAPGAVLSPSLSSQAQEILKDGDVLGLDPLELGAVTLEIKKERLAVSSFLGSSLN